MITFSKISKDTPYKVFKKEYDKALNAGQKNIEAIVISSFNKNENMVDSRYVNLKFVKGNKFYFFSNYNSPKSLAFKSHKQISALFYWPSTNVQIRMHASIKKTSLKFNKDYFQKRTIDTNALAICSNQSKKIASYEDVVSNYEITRKNIDLSKCPDYWGGFSFTPYYFEFWEGHESRINKREIYEINDGKWNHSFLQP